MIKNRLNTIKDLFTTEAQKKAEFRGNIQIVEEWARSHLNDNDTEIVSLCYQVISLCRQVKRDCI